MDSRDNDLLNAVDAHVRRDAPDLANRLAEYIGRLLGQIGVHVEHVVPAPLDQDMFLRADLPGLLHGWDGPVVTDAYGVAEPAVWCSERSVVWVPSRPRPRDGADVRVVVSRLAVDLSIGAVRDRVARWVAEVGMLYAQIRAVDLDPGTTAPAFRWEEPEDGEPGSWVLSDPMLDLRFGAFERRHPDFPIVGVPALRTLDPASTDRLPDATLRVNALALRHVAAHFGKRLRSGASA